MKKETLVQVFSSEFCKISKNAFFTKHVWATASASLAHQMPKLPSFYMMATLAFIELIMNNVCILGRFKLA